jgi:hypothetical protein
LNIPVGKYYIDAIKPGYEEHYYPVIVTDSKTTRADMQIWEE